MFTAHVLNDKKRTEDIYAETTADFESLLLSPKVVLGLQLAGFVQPSPIQLQAIPYAKCGVDLICQAKSGTGKTCVFAVCALEVVDVKISAIQVLVLAPTREIAHQINGVITAIGSGTGGLKCSLFIGGIPVEQDLKSLKSSHIAIGTPGRVKYLIEKGNLSTESIRLFVLDEADKLLEEGSFQEQINWIYSTLPKDKQVLALSATYPESLANHLANYMQEPVHIRINVGDLTLKGVKQYMTKTMFHPFPVKAFEEKCERLIEIIRNIPFQQCMVFSNFHSRAENLSKKLCKEGWPCTFIAGSQIQMARLRAMDQLKNYNCRVLITTDLTARGIDCDKVDLVINLDLPWETETYLHRVGRAGRFGSFGIAISIVSEGDEFKKIQSISMEIGKEISLLPDDFENVKFQSDAHDSCILVGKCDNDSSKEILDDHGKGHVPNEDDVPVGTSLILSGSIDDTNSKICVSKQNIKLLNDIEESVLIDGKTIEIAKLESNVKEMKESKENSCDKEHFVNSDGCTSDLDGDNEISQSPLESGSADIESSSQQYNVSYVDDSVLKADNGHEKIEDAASFDKTALLHGKPPTDSNKFELPKYLALSEKIKKTRRDKKKVTNSFQNTMDNGAEPKKENLCENAKIHNNINSETRNPSDKGLLKNGVIGYDINEKQTTFVGERCHDEHISDTLIKDVNKMKICNDISDKSSSKEILSKATENFEGDIYCTGTKNKPLRFDLMSLNLCLMNVESAQDLHNATSKCENEVAGNNEREVIFQRVEDDIIDNDVSSSCSSFSSSCSSRGCYSSRKSTEYEFDLQSLHNINDGSENVSHNEYPLQDEYYKQSKKVVNVETSLDDEDYKNHKENSDENDYYSDSELSTYSEDSSDLDYSTDSVNLTDSENSTGSENSSDFENCKYAWKSSEDSGCKSNEIEIPGGRRWNKELFNAHFYKAYRDHISFIQNYCHSLKGAH